MKGDSASFRIFDIVQLTEQSRRNRVFEPRSQISFNGADVVKIILQVLPQAPGHASVIRPDGEDEAQALEDLEPMLDRMGGNLEVFSQRGEGRPRADARLKEIDQNLDRFDVADVFQVKQVAAGIVNSLDPRFPVFPLMEFVEDNECRTLVPFFLLKDGPVPGRVIIQIDVGGK